MRMYQATLVLSISLLAAGAAQAQDRFLHATGDPLLPSSFLLDFGDLGGVSSGSITQTELTLRINRTTGTAAMTAYQQEVEPLFLPGGVSTGNIHVEILPGTSFGTYNPTTGEFSTMEFYAIYFDGDLSAYNLESPVFLPGNSTGVISPANGKSGRITMAWDGQGQLENPFDPEHPIIFDYVCSVNAVFGPALQQAGLGGLVSLP